MAPAATGVAMAPAATAPAETGGGARGAVTIDTAVEIALGHHQSGRLAEAEAIYRQILQAAPDHWKALHLYGVALHQLGQHEAGLTHIDRALALNPDFAAALGNRGLVLLRLGRLAEAEASLRHALRIAPEATDALCNLGNVLRAGGRWDEALALYQQAHKLKPTAIDPLMSMGSLSAEVNRLDDALACFNRVVAIDANYRPVLPHIGAALRNLGRMEEATPYFERMAQLNPDQADALGNLGVVYKDQSRTDEARACFQRAWEIGGDPAMLLKRIVALPVITQSREDIAQVRRTFLDGVADFVRHGHTLNDPVRQVGQTCFYLAYHALDDLPLQKAVADLYARACPSLLHTAPHCRPDAVRRPSPDGRWRVGFISEHFFLHTIGQLNHGLLQHLPKDRFHVTVFVTPRPMDRLRHAITSAADQVVEIPLDLAEARRRIGAQELDLLYYTDLGMTPFTYFLAFSRLAPVQTLTWGHPDSTGIPALDHFITCDAMEPDDGERHYSEALARLPGPTVHYPRPTFPGPFKDRAGFGLPEDDHLYVCPQSLFKIHPDYDPLLVEILRRDPKGRLVFVQGKHPHPWRLLHARIARSGPDVADRIVAVPPLATMDFVALMAASDVMLDPLHYSGGNTSLEAFSQGVPIVTWPGEFMRGRHTHGWYKLMGIDDLVARDWPHYVELAVRCGTDPEWNRHLRRRILEANGVLFEQTATITAIADFLESAIRRRLG